MSHQLMYIFDFFRATVPRKPLDTLSHSSELTGAVHLVFSLLNHFLILFLTINSSFVYILSQQCDKCLSSFPGTFHDFQTLSSNDLFCPTNNPNPKCLFHLYKIYTWKKNSLTNDSVPIEFKWHKLSVSPLSAVVDHMILWF